MTIKKYTNKQLQEICRKEWKIFNNHNFADGQAFLLRNRAITGRMSQSASWSITKAGVNLSRNSAWYEHGSRYFTIGNRKEIEPKFSEAKAWDKEKFGITEWARGPFGAYYDKSFCEKRLAEIIAKHEANNEH